jgi:hypothetical protein
VTDAEGGVSRRRFVRGALTVGTVAGATAWVAPQLSSVAMAQETAGSDPPTPTTTIRVSPGAVQQDPAAAELGAGTGAGAGGGRAGGGAQVGGAGAQRDPGGTLPVTGIDARRLAAAGAGATAAGSALLAADRFGGTTKIPAVTPEVDPSPEDLAEA